MKTNGNQITAAMDQATNLTSSTSTATAGRPSASEGERSEHERVQGLPAVARARAISPEVPAQAARRRYSAEYKLKILAQYDNCQNSGEVGALLRREGLYSSHLTKWRRQRADGQLAALAPQKRGRKHQVANPLAAEVARLQRENERLTKKLHQAETIIEVQKKISQLLGIAQPEFAQEG